MPLIRGPQPGVGVSWGLSGLSLSFLPVSNSPELLRQSGAMQLKG